MAKSFLRRFTKRFFIIPTILLVGIYLIGVFSPYLNPNKWWPLGFISLLMPYLIVILILTSLFWFIAKPLIGILTFLSLLLGVKSIQSIFAFNKPKTFHERKTNDNDLRIISWNVGNMGGIFTSEIARETRRQEILNSINGETPDIICLQEFNNSQTRGESSNNLGFFRQEYPYYYFNKDVNDSIGSYQYGSVIFSKYPIIDTGRIDYLKDYKESFCYADIKYNQDTIRVYNVHLQSFKFSASDYSQIHQIKSKKVIIGPLMDLVYKMKKAFTRRGVQADIIRDSIQKTPFRSFICGDFNDVPSSYVYTHIKGARKDAFLEVGFGIGNTYSSLAPTLRIDYIMPDKKFDVKQFKLVDEDLSDHFMLVSDLSVKK